VVFLFSAIVSGIALVLVIYMITTMVRSKAVDMACLDKLATFLFYAMVIDFSLEMLDFIHRLYESEESISILSQMISSRLFISLIILQILLGTLVPMIALGVLSPALWKGGLIKVTEELRRLSYLGSSVLVLIGIFSIRWNVVIGGQLFSKSLRGLTVYKLDVFGLEGVLVATGLMILPFLLLWGMVRVAPPWADARPQE
jgi:formate-dependent nitrite reductase membrane component NrfD